MKRFTSAALVAATAVLGTLLASGTAQAADPVGTISAYARPDGIGVMTEKPMPAFVAHIRKKGSETRIQTVKEFRHTAPGCAGCLEVYQSDGLRFADLGLYSVDVEYKGTKGERILRKAVAELDYRALARFENKATSKKVSLDSLDTTLSADLIAYDPRNGVGTPLAGRKVTVALEGQSLAVSTDAAGHFSTPVTYTGTEKHLGGTLAHDSADHRGEFTTIDPRVERLPVKITLDEGSRSVTAPYDHDATIRGTITRAAPDGTRKPVATSMLLTIPNAANNRFTTSAFTSDAAGRFTKSAKVLESSTWKVGTAYNQPWYVISNGADVSATVTAGTSIDSVTMKVDRDRKVSGQAVLVQHATSAAPGSAKVEVQYSADGRTGWSTRTTVDAIVNRYFKVPTLENAPVDGYWRLRYAGTPELHGSTSKPVRLTRTVTAVADFNAKPEPVRKGQYLTLTGALEQRAASATTWRPYAAQIVRFYFKPAGTGTSYAYVGSTTSAADGSFSRRFTATKDGTWQARFHDDGTTHFASSSREDYVEVTG
ncbi:hypothetical protein OG730_18000 [Streptomyces sp. NBC_01298]|uniref:hypothetical protein n=1 Tax=Streptomyces sp. NBC_01298 TaxID=2903817 RepID=UPI002E1616C1|nr:hypothetical protein OG730_18000 [Streptomyces sp. NBC_01298]